VYVACELSVLIGFLLFPMPGEVVAIVWAIFTLHLPLGLLQPRWFLTGEIVGPRKQPLLLPCLAAVWLMSWVKLGAAQCTCVCQRKRTMEIQGIQGIYGKERTLRRYP